MPLDSGSNGSKSAPRINSSGREGAQNAAAHSQDWDQERANGSKKPETGLRGGGAKVNGTSEGAVVKPGRNNSSEKQVWHHERLKVGFHLLTSTT